MTWTLALAATPTGIGAAKLGAAGSPHILGFFPEIDRAMRAAAQGEESKLPGHTVLISEVGIPPYELKWYLGELVIEKIPARDVQVRSDIEVLSTAYGAPVLLIDADRDIMVPPPATRGEPIHVGRASEIMEADPAIRPVLIGHPDTRGGVVEAFAELSPEVIDRQELARLALFHPTTESIVTIPESASEAEPTETKDRKTLNLVLILVVAAAIVLGVSFLF
ncbi:hypothetical protein CATRI_03210 [Corynebacterium atrinae]|uniref:hypothetical protein n=1 Tax=Corynebacterium atrinae TaxID=1336740 RepID=UPI0025B51BE5|nr:hypothetical protein [Corynebacterium atrinae]WJY62746.1 hypothetical protein CATRI_03210 [Corynebacterium atrinae]